MTSIVTSILKCTIGVLFNKGRDLMAEKLKDGDVADQKFRELILRELDDLKSKIDGLARKDLLASLSFFREGIVSLYQQENEEVAHETTRAGVGMKDEKPTASTLPSLGSDASKLSVNTNCFFLVDKNKMLNLNELSETSKQLLLDAKKRFEDARRRAIDAFSNEALKTSDRLLAMKIRILATIMEKIDRPADAFELCKLCLEELHNMPVVQNCFLVEMTKTMKSMFNKHERREVVANICQINYAVHRLTRIVTGCWSYQVELPLITIDHLQIDPLRDHRMIKAVKEFEVEHCMLEWTFGSEGKPSHKLHCPFSITTNTQGQFIVADSENIKVFDPLGKLLYSVLSSERGILATDKNDNLYLCKRFGERSEICVFDRNYDLHHRFSLRAGVSKVEFFTISNDNQVFVVVQYSNSVYQVDVYENDGRFVHSFGEDVLSQRWSPSITTSGDGVMILDTHTKCVHVFSAQGAHLYKFELNKCDRICRRIAFFEPNQHVFILSEFTDARFRLSIYTKDGKLVHTHQLPNETVFSEITVTVEGKVAVINEFQGNVHVLQL